MTELPEQIPFPDLLCESALAAARLWVFRPIELAGLLVKVEGLLIFNVMLE